MRRKPIVKANEIRQKRQNHNGCFLVVEGRDDRLFFEQFIDTDACKVIVADGKQNVAEVIGILDAKRFPGVVGVVDADLDHIEGIEQESDNVIVLETVDLEALLIQSPALDRVLVERGSAAKIARFGKDVRKALLEATLMIGCLRLHSMRTRLSLKFGEINYAKCIDEASLTVDVHFLVREVKNCSRRFDLRCQDLVQSIDSIQLSLEDPWLVCYGADMVALLAFGLRKTLGTNNSQAVAPDVLRMSLRLAFQRSDLNKSQLASDLHDWTARNVGFSILR